jgi:hypothetical protein
METAPYLSPQNSSSSHAVYAYGFWLIVLCAGIAWWQGIPILLVLLLGCVFYLLMVVAVNSLNIYYQPTSKSRTDVPALPPDPTQNNTPVLLPPAPTLVRQPDGSYIVRR